MIWSSLRVVRRDRVSSVCRRRTLVDMTSLRAYKDARGRVSSELDRDNGSWESSWVSWPARDTDQWVCTSTLTEDCEPGNFRQNGNNTQRSMCVLKCKQPMFSGKIRLRADFPAASKTIREVKQEADGAGHQLKSTFRPNVENWYTDPDTEHVTTDKSDQATFCARHLVETQWIQTKSICSYILLHD